MNIYSKFRKDSGLSSQETEMLTGYTRQGLNFAFRQIYQCKQPSEQFIICINEAVKIKFDDEKIQFDRKMARLKSWRNKRLQIY